MNVADWAPIQDRMGKLQIALGAPHDLMMLSIDVEGRPTAQDIYIGLPQASLLSAFRGFEEVDRSAIPDFVSTLIAREDGFRALFPDIAAKRRTRY
jgi:hypothetical protein